MEQLEGRPLGMTDYCTDLTALRQAEPELRALTFTSLGHIPVLKADGQEAHYYDGRSVAPKRLSLDSARSSPSSARSSAKGTTTRPS